MCRWYIWEWRCWTQGPCHHRVFTLRASARQYGAFVKIGKRCPSCGCLQPCPNTPSARKARIGCQSQAPLAGCHQLGLNEQGPSGGPCQRPTRGTCRMGQDGCTLETNSCARLSSRQCSGSMFEIYLNPMETGLQLTFALSF